MQRLQGHDLENRLSARKYNRLILTWAMSKIGSQFDNVVFTGDISLKLEHSVLTVLIL
jgi:hypothetical protein